MPNSSRINNNNLLPAGNSKVDSSRDKKVEVNVSVTKKISGLEPLNQNIISHREVITIT